MCNTVFVAKIKKLCGLAILDIVILHFTGHRQVRETLLKTTDVKAKEFKRLWRAVQEAKAYVTHTSFPRNEPLVSGDGRHTVGTVLQSVHDRTVPGLQEDLSPYHTHTHTHTYTLYIWWLLLQNGKMQNIICAIDHWHKMDKYLHFSSIVLVGNQCLIGLFFERKW